MNAESDVGAHIGDHHTENVFLTEKKKDTVRSELLNTSEWEHAPCHQGDGENQTNQSNLLPLEHEDLFLDFPVTIRCDDVSSSCNVIDGQDTISATNNALAMNTSRSMIERNKSLCGGNNFLTAEEMGRISELLREEDADGDTHGLCSEREAELDNLLLGLGYDVHDHHENDFDSTNTGSGLSHEPGEPALRALAKQRNFDEHERRVNQALFALLREPLPLVVRVPDVGADEAEDGISFLRSCGETTTLSAAVTEVEMKELVQKVKEELLEDDMMLADGASVQRLARSLLGRPRGAPGGALWEQDVTGADDRSVMLLLEREIRTWG